MAEQPRQRPPQPEWSQAIERLGTIAAQGSDLSNLAESSHNSTARLYATVGQLLDLVQQLNAGRLTAEEVIAAATQAGNIQRGDVQRIQQALNQGPSQEEIQEIIQRAADAITPDPQPPAGGAKKRRRRGGYKRSPTSGERRIASGSTRRKRSSRGKRSKRSPTKKRTRTRTGGRRRR